MNPTLIIILIMLALGLCGAIYAFIKTPSSKRYKFYIENFVQIAQDNPEYAPLYSKKEQKMLALKMAIPAVILLLFAEFWFKSWFNQFALYAHCYQYGIFSGTQLVYHGIFVGLPLLIALAWLFFEGRRCIKIIQIGQDPLPGEKVLRLTKYSYGIKAKLKAYVSLSLNLFLLGFATQGYFWAQTIIKDTSKIDKPACHDVLR